MILTKEIIKWLEANKTGLKTRIEQGFKWPARTGDDSPFIELEKEIGAEAMDNTEKAAYWVYCALLSGGWLPHLEQKLELSSNHPFWKHEEREHFKACKQQLKRFDNSQAIKELKPLAAIGEKRTKVRKQSFIKAFGTQEERDKTYKNIKEALDSTYQQHPELKSYEKIYDKALELFPEAFLKTGKERDIYKYHSFSSVKKLYPISPRKKR